MTSMSESDRIYAFSILKSEYGWNGVEPAGCADLDVICASANGPICAANQMAKAIHAVVGQQYFRPRLDGKPNRRTVK